MPRYATEHSLAIWAILLMGTACGPQSGSDAGPDAGGETLFFESPPMWFDAYFTWLEVSPDRERAVFDYRRLIDLRTGDELAMPGDLDVVFRARFDTDGSLMVAGRRGERQGWFRPEAGTPASNAGLPDETLPARYVIEPSPAGDRFAYWIDDDRRTLLTVARVEPGRPTPEPTATSLPEGLAGLAWTPDGNGIVAYTMDEEGVGSLHLVDPILGVTRTVAEALDGGSFGGRLAISYDGSVAYLAMAGPDAPVAEARHEPAADRDLDIWEVDLASGERRPVVVAPGEQLAPQVVDGVLHWVSIDTRSEVVIVPIARSGGAAGDAMSGPAQVVASGVQLGTWRPDGRALGVTTGNWRLADWALNLDGGVIEIDATGSPTGPVQPIITGYHEDFSPVWSPDGSWIAFHSHRSDTPVSGYSAASSSDDIYLRRPEAPDRDEIRLTDFGWEVGNPDWAPDGRRLVMDSWNQDGGSSTWIIELDPETGAFVDRIRVPTPEGAVGGPAWEAWSPVRDELAVTYAGATRTELWLMAPDGSGARRLGAWDGGRYGGLDWSADGETIVYAAPMDGRYRLYGVSRAGGRAWLVAEDEANLLHPQVSPDGRWVAASRMVHERRIMRR